MKPDSPCPPAAKAPPQGAKSPAAKERLGKALRKNLQRRKAPAPAAKPQD